MNCNNCGAPLPATSNVCKFCKTLNDTDLRAIPRPGGAAQSSDRQCPHCDTQLMTLNIGTTEVLHVDRCPDCLGIFFDRGELETVLDSNVQRVFEVDLQRMQELTENERQVAAQTEVVRYIKCPVCRQMMNRRAYGTRSGVIVDRCRQHGIWLDAGELGQLLKWVKAGGRMYHEKREVEKKRAEEIDRKVESNIRMNRPVQVHRLGPDSVGGGLLDGIDLLDVFSVIGRFLR
jgi:Zn-finger nucleic acid-binding protein